MSPSLSIEQLRQLKVIMQSMLSEASNANWQELSRLDSERRVLINYKAATSVERKILGNPASQNAQQQQSEIDNGSGSTDRLNNSQRMRLLPSLGSAHSAKPSPSDLEYQALSAELTAIDKRISSTVQEARKVLLEQTRGLKAQVSAKKGYEQTKTMKVSSYS
ncbi:hypothetical protein [Granulosicoccus antarcticus]|uniref:Flagellar protein FliT n=1 Tax=Granulosicoccus antarcticus IMCC3135 TaxID=1192854 RepID=A0A2Z2NXC2_9GAMM|nr:hypothetical protein [Granulosicoccus antarcticus]ASJ71794.1 hypothetical protein IMCC3135_08475 [Granulosicoccus antarcticus IMCC3135]